MVCTLLWYDVRKNVACNDVYAVQFSYLFITIICELPS